jgi:D-arabinose 1-dehydrogenase-like Zn-dependent alcohol dehydrogenase
MTTGPLVSFSMSAVLKNVDLRGSTMGSREEFRQMVQFIRDNNLHPVISRKIRGLDSLSAIDDLFLDMKNGSQFGKLVIEMDDSIGALNDSSTQYDNKL